MADILEIVAPKRRALAAAKRLVHLRDEAVQDENMRAVILHAAEIVAKSGVLSAVAESGQNGKVLPHLTCRACIPTATG